MGRVDCNSLGGSCLMVPMCCARWPGFLRSLLTLSLFLRLKKTCIFAGFFYVSAIPNQAGCTSHIAHRTSVIAHISSLRVWSPDLTRVAGSFIKHRLVLTPLIPGSKWLTRSPQSGFTSPRTASFCGDCDPPLSLHPDSTTKKTHRSVKFAQFSSVAPCRMIGLT